MSGAYAELAVTTNFSFLRGASHPRELVVAAGLLKLSAIGIADRNSLAGVVRAFDGLNQIEGEKPKLLVGSRLVFADGTPDVLAYPTDRAAYGRLCRLISEGTIFLPGRKACCWQWWRVRPSLPSLTMAGLRAGHPVGSRPRAQKTCPFARKIIIHRAETR
jgi:DNA polymerase III alpha subunit